MSLAKFSLLWIAGTLGTTALCQPMTAHFEHSASYRWLNKEVLESHLLDNMDHLEHWYPFTTEAPQLVDARVENRTTDTPRSITEMTISREQSMDGSSTLRMRQPTRLDVTAPKNGRGWGTTGVRRQFDHEDWTASNRLSLWIYPDNPGFYVNWIELRIFNDGTEKLPALFGQEGENTLMLRNHEWNHVVWEIGNVARDQITDLEVSFYLSGSEPFATDTATFYLDRLELQKVMPDHIEGWNVWPGRISYSHSGYQPGTVKTAIANGLAATEFSLIKQETGETVLTKSIEPINTHLGSYQAMDFSEVWQSGTYILKAGNVRTNAFRISDDVWRTSIIKALNFFYMERCGMTIPGVHGICHRDWRCIHGDREIIVNGGWHDAGDLTQSFVHTSEAVYAMLSLAERLKQANADEDLYRRLIEEATWGLNWVLKTSFRDGFRFGGMGNSRKTNGIIGDEDDLIVTARRSPMDLLSASASEALAYNVLKHENPFMANFSLEMAEEDWKYALDELSKSPSDDAPFAFRGTFDPNNVEHDPASAGILAAMELWKATGKQAYADQAFEWAKIIFNSQQQTRPDWDIPFTGFLYTSTKKDQILHYVHRGNEQATILALKLLCDLFQEHPDWMSWYASVVLHSEYMKKIATYTSPYGVMPASIYNDREYLLAPESRQLPFKRQVLNGIPLGKGHYLRLFPVWMDYRGHFGVILPQAQALIYAARLRGDIESVRLAQHQAEWVIGRNPFSQSTMWGEGYDFPPLYSVMSGDMVGGLPVGIQTRGDADVPYWPVQNSWTYKEIWVRPVIRWIWLMRDLAGPARLEVRADSPIEMKNELTGQVTHLNTTGTNGLHKSTIPQGNYSIRYQGKEIHRTFLPAASYKLDLGQVQNLHYTISKKSADKDQCIIRVDAIGRGNHQFVIRTFNLTVDRPEKALSLKDGIRGSVEWRCKISNPDMPWVAVVVPNNDHSMRQELHGASWE